ncbi:MAG: glycosyltransferase family 2 protein [Actinomycetia bacterium]|nr:glycosyltransferase family 2 protein [Actinomycetes bacterium]
MAGTEYRRRDSAAFQSPIGLERRRPRRPEHGEPWSYVLNGASKRVAVTIIVPARNEAPNLAALFTSLPPVYEVILVDGDSVDGTIDVARELLPSVRIVRQRGRGKGDAMIEGLEAARGDIAVFIDADGSNEPDEVERFVLALVNGADLAKGSRFLERGGSTDITGIRRLGNSVIRSLVNCVYGTRFTDVAYGFNAVWTKHRDVLDLDCNGFEIETLLHIRAARLGFVIEEVPSFERERSTGCSNLNPFRDGLRIAALLTRELTDQFVNRRPTAHNPRA